MEYSKPKVTIDLDEYTELKDKATGKTDALTGIDQDKLPEVLGILIAGCTESSILAMAMHLEQDYNVKMTAAQELGRTMLYLKKLPF